MSNTAGIKHWIKVDLFGREMVVRLGDIVWFYPGCSMTSTPQCATVTQISEDNMIDLSIVNTDVSRKVSQKHICLINSPPLLNNPKNRDRGCWCPRTPVESIMLSPDKEG